MKKTHSLHSLLSLLFLLGAASAHAQLYKWVGPDGKVTYSDTLPPASARQVETKPVNAGGGNTTDLPYELSEAVKNNPVTLYTTAKCGACDEGRQLLAARGIPFSEKTVNTDEDVSKLRQVSGATQLPVLIVGRNKQNRFEANAWGGALTAAGYPETSKLPKTYRNASAEAAAPVVKATALKQPGSQSATGPADDLPPAIGNAPPGFRF
jgi:glutaredoxin